MRVLIADDDPLTVEQLVHHVHKLAPDARIQCCTNGMDAAKALLGSSFDALLLDLDMPGMNGRELLGAHDPGCPVIIVTGDPDFAVEAFRFRVADYLLKPVSFERLAQAWKRITERTVTRDEGVKETVFIREGNDIVRVRLADVRFVRSESNYVRFKLDGREVSSLMNMKDLERKLPERFIRVHRSYIVNLDHVDRLDTHDIKIGGDLIPVSESYRAELLKRLELL